MGLVDYGSDSDDEEIHPSTSRPSTSITSTSRLESRSPLNPSAKDHASFMSLPPPREAPLPATSFNSPSSASHPVEAPKADVTRPSSHKKGKGPMRILLELPPPSADGTPALSEGETTEDGPRKKSKLELGNGKEKKGLTGLAALLPAPKHKTPIVTQQLPPTLPSKRRIALGGVGEFVPGSGWDSSETPTTGNELNTVSSTNGGAHSHGSVVDFFGLTSVTSDQSAPSEAPIKTIRPSLSISSAPKLTTASQPPVAAADRVPTADDPYPGFTQLPSGQWVAKDQETYERWMEAMSSAEQQSDSGIGIDGFQMPKGFSEKDIRGVGGILDTDEEVKRSREAWANRPQIIPRPGSEPNDDLAKLKAPPKAPGAGRAKQRGQLSALLADAVANRAELEERIAQGRANRKSAGNKYEQPCRNDDRAQYRSVPVEMPDARGPRPKALQNTAEELGTYGERELEDDYSTDSGPALDIDPLSDMSLAALRRLARYRPPPDPYPFPARRAAVMVALFGSRNGNKLNVLLSTRSTELRSYAGDVALPGGRMDATDINLEATARREAYEEVGLPYNPNSVRYLTSLPPFLARSLLLVTPVVCLILDYSVKGFLSENVTPEISNAVPPEVQSGEKPFHIHRDYTWFGGQPHRFHGFSARPRSITGLTAEILIAVAQVAYGRDSDFSLEAPGQLSSEIRIKHAMADPKWLAKIKDDAKNDKASDQSDDVALRHKL